MSRIPWLWNLLSQYWLEIETSFCFSGPLELVNFRLKSLLETTFAQSKQICSFDDGDTHTRSIDLVGVESAHSATEVIACVAWRFWLGALSNKGGRGQRNREEIGAGATEEKNEVKGTAVKNPSNPGRRFFFFSRLRRSCLPLVRSCARLDKTAMLRRLLKSRTCKWNPKPQMRVTPLPIFGAKCKWKPIERDKSTSRDFVPGSRPLRGQTRLAPLAKRSTCSNSNRRSIN